MREKELGASPIRGTEADAGRHVNLSEFMTREKVAAQFAVNVRACLRKINRQRVNADRFGVSASDIAEEIANKGSIDDVGKAVAFLSDVFDAASD